MEVSFVWKSWQERRQAFTLVEIMIVVALIGLLAALAVPTFIQARKQSQGKRIVNDARIIDGAINAWALNTGQADGNDVDLVAAGQYIKSGAISTTDILGNPWDLRKVGTNQIAISSSTKAELAGVTIDWGSY
jgi:prepilin-type N-terminal cleavage/methylation domain-containing protein